ncbi:MAG: hypothetical protein GC154_02680 [bacterium]|nr:hypothetical protein [bacterium]
MKKIIFALTALTAFCITSFADVTMEVIDLTNRRVELTYTVADNLAGNTTFLFPSGGFYCDTLAAPVKVVTVQDMKTRQELQYDVVDAKATNLPQLKIKYPTAVSKGEPKQLLIRVQLTLPVSDIGVDQQNRYYFVYETSHPFEFIIPFNHYVVYTSIPMLVYETESMVTLKNEQKENRKILIKTRPIPAKK